MTFTSVQVRRLDASSPGGMDTYAYLLYSLCKQSDGTPPQITSSLEEELSLLASDMLNACPRLAVGWVAAALYTDIKGDVDKAIGFIEKVIVILRL
jgi:hypothetical protein